MAAVSSFNSDAVFPISFHPSRNHPEPRGSSDTVGLTPTTHNRFSSSIEKTPVTTVWTDDSLLFPISGISSDHSHPDGGVKAWLTVAGAFASIFTTFGWLSCTAVFQSYYETMLPNSSRVDISLLQSTTFFCTFSMQIFAGKVFDNYGPRIPLAVGSIMHTGGIFAASFSSKYYQIFLAQAVCAPIGASFILSSAVPPLSTWFKVKISQASGIAFSGSSVGAITLPIILNQLLDKIGYAWTMRVTSFIFAGLLIFANLSIKSNLKPNPRPIRLIQYFQPLKNPNFVILEIAAFTFGFSMFIPENYIITSAISFGMTSGLTVYLVVILSVTGLLGRFACVIIADRFGQWNFTIFLCLLTALSISGLWEPARSDGLMIAFAVFFGFGGNTSLGMFPVLVGSISPVEDIGVYTGINQAAIGLSALIGPPIAGTIVTASSGSYVWAATFCSLCGLAATFCLCVIRVRLNNWKTWRT